MAENLNDKTNIAHQKRLVKSGIIAEGPAVVNPNSWLCEPLHAEPVGDDEGAQWHSLLSRLQPLTQTGDSTPSARHDRGGSPTSGTAAEMNRSEIRLVSLAVALMGKTQPLSKPETRLIVYSQPVVPLEVAWTREQILAGHDPLGTEFCLLRSAAQRRPYGATYTPPLIVETMAAWACAETSTPARVVDPGCGSGRFLVAAARNFPHAQLVGVEIDPLAALMLRANAAVHGFDKRLTLHLADYRSVVLPAVSGSTLFIGNPPYVRHHDISDEWKCWFASAAGHFGIRASKLAGLHIHFFVKTRELARPGDYGAFITAAEWLDVNYGSTLRRMLANGLGGSALHVIRPEARAFDDALTTSAITCFRVGSRPQEISMRSVGSLDELAPLRRGRPIDVTEAINAPKWTVFLRERTQKPAGFIELFSVHRGQVTGNNSVWIETEASRLVPRRYKPFTVTKARELIVAETDLISNRGLRRVVDLPADLDALDEEERKTVQRFLAWARQQAAHEGYVARHRRAWWSVGLRAPAPILCTYMGRRPPAFVRNRAGARHINIAHGLYPRETVSESMFAATLAYLRRHVSAAEGRTYAGGLVKFEPKEIERIVMPQPGDMHAYLAQSEESPQTLVDARAAGGRDGREARLSS